MRKEFINWLIEHKEEILESEKGYKAHILFAIHLLVWILITFVIVLISLFFVPSPMHKISVSDFILLITAGIIAAYTYETRKMSKQMQRSNEIQEEPLLNLYFKEIGNTGLVQDGRITIKNIGKGPSYDITIEKFSLAGYSYRFYVEDPMLESSQETPLRMTVKTPDGGTEGSSMTWFLSRLNPQNITPKSIEHARNNPAIFLLRFKGINGKSYYSIFAFYSTLPPAGHMVMQFIERGVGNISMGKALEAVKIKDRIYSPFEN